MEGALAHLVARVVRSYWGGDHSLFIGHVEYARYGSGTPLLFHGGRYEHLTATGPLFSALSPDVLQRILASGSERTFAAGEAIVRRGEAGDDLFVVVDGTVRVERDGRTLVSLGPGEFFGEIAVFDERPRSADVTAETRVRCIAISRDALRDALALEPEAAWAMLQVLASRLRDD